MRRLMDLTYQICRGLWALLLGGVLLGVAVNALSDWQLPKKLLEYCLVHWVSIALGFVTLAVLTISSAIARERHQRRGRFFICKPVGKFRPTDLSFPVIRDGEKAKEEHAPLHRSYVPRTIVEHGDIENNRPANAYAEQRLVKELREGRGLILLGPTWAGKSRTLYEVVRQMNGYWIVTPHWDRDPPDEDTFKLLRNRAVILLLDDLHYYVNSTPNLMRVCDALGNSARTWAVAAALRIPVRDVPETGVTYEATTPLDEFRTRHIIGLELAFDAMTERERALEAWLSSHRPRSGMNGNKLRAGRKAMKANAAPRAKNPR